MGFYSLERICLGFLLWQAFSLLKCSLALYPEAFPQAETLQAFSLTRLYS